MMMLKFPARFLFPLVFLLAVPAGSQDAVDEVPASPTTISPDEVVRGQ